MVSLIQSEAFNEQDLLLNTVAAWWQKMESAGWKEGM
jgi:hypothetical protein